MATTSSAFNSQPNVEPPAPHPTHGKNTKVLNTAPVSKVGRPVIIIVCEPEKNPLFVHTLVGNILHEYGDGVTSVRYTHPTTGVVVSKNIINKELAFDIKTAESLHTIRNEAIILKVSERKLAIESNLKEIESTLEALKKTNTFDKEAVSSKFDSYNAALISEHKIPEKEKINTTQETIKNAVEVESPDVVREESAVITREEDTTTIQPEPTDEEAVV